MTRDEIKAKVLDIFCQQQALRAEHEQIQALCPHPEQEPVYWIDIVKTYRMTCKDCGKGLRCLTTEEFINMETERRRQIEEFLAAERAKA